MGKRSRTKGHSFERWVAAKLRHIFPDAIRQLEYQQGFGIDISNTGRLKIQCKCHKTYAPISKIKEAGSEGIPMLITKGDREIPIVCLSFKHFLDIIKNPKIIFEE